LGTTVVLIFMAMMVMVMMLVMVLTVPASDGFTSRQAQRMRQGKQAHRIEDSAVNVRGTVDEDRLEHTRKGTTRTRCHRHAALGEIVGLEVIHVERGDAQWNRTFLESLGRKVLLHQIFKQLPFQQSPHPAYIPNVLTLDSNHSFNHVRRFHT
jgi:hypothetical protein